jgi:multicomponent Na+:H+ antiporter subunit F
MAEPTHPAAWADAGLWLAAALIAATIVLGLLRVERGPAPADRMLAAQLLGTGAAAVLLLLARATAQPALLDVALVIALMAAVATAVFVRRIGVQAGARGPGADAQPDSPPPPPPPRPPVP